MWEYRARPRRVIDGDTIVVRADLGFGQEISKVRIRFLDVNTPELRSKDPAERAAARAAKRFVEEWLMRIGEHEWPLHIATVGCDSFGRWLGHVRPHHDAAGAPTLSEVLLAEGHATPYVKR